MGSSKVPLFTMITSTNLEAYDIPAGHSCVLMAQHMAEVHNIMSRLFNASYIQAPKIKPNTKDTVNFLQWNQLVINMLVEHHDAEEAEIFPTLETFAGKPGLLTQNIKEHETFHDAVDALVNYFAKTKKEDYNGQQVCRLWENLAPALNSHLGHEPETLLQFKDADSDGIKKVFKQLSEAIMKRSDPFTGAILFLSGQDNKFPGINGQPAAIFAEMPTFVQYIFAYVIARRHRRLWKFNPADSFGNVRPEFA